MPGCGTDLGGENVADKHQNQDGVGPCQCALKPGEGTFLSGNDQDRAVPASRVSQKAAGSPQMPLDANRDFWRAKSTDLPAGSL